MKMTTNNHRITLTTRRTLCKPRTLAAIGVDTRTWTKSPSPNLDKPHQRIQIPNVVEAPSSHMPPDQGKHQLTRQIPVRKRLVALHIRYPKAVRRVGCEPAIHQVGGSVTRCRQTVAVRGVLP